MIVLDTHIWFRWVTCVDPLPSSVASAIEMENYVAVSAISVWEIARLSQRGRINLKRDISGWLDSALAGAGIDCIPIGMAIALRAALLPEIHRDPADRLIISTALESNATLISFDSVFPAYEELRGRLLGEKGGVE